MKTWQDWASIYIGYRLLHVLCHQKESSAYYGQYCRLSLDPKLLRYNPLGTWSQSLQCSKEPGTIKSMTIHELWRKNRLSMRFHVRSTRCPT